MSIMIRRNPVRQMAAMQNVVDRMLEDAWRERDTINTTDHVLAVDVHESNEDYVLVTNLPGVNPDDINVTIHDGVLSIEATLPQNEPAEGVRAHIQERPYGRYTRSLRLPRVVNGDAVQASYEYGVLTLTLPKTPEAQPRQIRINNGKPLSNGN